MKTQLLEYLTDKINYLTGGEELKSMKEILIDSCIIDELRQIKDFVSEYSDTKYYFITYSYLDGLLSKTKMKVIDISPMKFITDSSHSDILIISSQEISLDEYEEYSKFK